MASNATVVDSLIVKLGLDPKDFTAGEKKAAASTVQLEKQVQKSSKSMGSEFLALTGKLLGFATAVIAVKKIASGLDDAAESVRQLGIDSRNLNIAANELRNFGNVAELNGGKAQDATKTISGLSKAVYDLAYNGAMSDSLMMLGRLGVRFQDTAGGVRDFKDIVTDTQASIQTRMRNGTSRANAYQMLMQAGFDPGLANAMLQGNAMEQLQGQQKHRQVSSSDVSALTKYIQSKENLGQATEADAVRAASATLPKAGGLFDMTANALDAGGNVDISKVTNTIGRALSSATHAVIDFAEGVKNANWSLKDLQGRNLPVGRAGYESYIAGSAKKYGIPYNVAMGLFHQESNFNPHAVSSTGRVGIAQLTPGSDFPNAGQNPYADINMGLKYLAKLHGAHPGDDDYRLSLQDYNAGARGASEMRSGVRPWKKETAEYSNRVLGYQSQATVAPSAQAAGGGRGGVDITFENININANGPGGVAIANDFTDAVHRKLLAAQADRAMN